VKIRGKIISGEAIRGQVMSIKKLKCIFIMFNTSGYAFFSDDTYVLFPVVFAIVIPGFKVIA
jgi:hypothetical protein